MALLSGCQLPIINARSLLATAAENELAAAAQTRRTKVEISGPVIDISAGQSDRLVIAENSGQQVTTAEVLRKPFVTFDVDGVRVIASLSDEDQDAALALKRGENGVLLCRFGHFDRSSAGNRLLILEYCRGR